jgi:hypothetical protein
MKTARAVDVHGLARRCFKALEQSSCEDLHGLAAAWVAPTGSARATRGAFHAN